MLFSPIPFLLGAAMAAQSVDPHDVRGTYLTEDGQTKVEVSDCGDGTPCGRVVWVNPEALSADERNTVLRDTENPDAEQRGRPIIGMPLLYGFERADDRWRRGQIYDPQEGDTYRASIGRRAEGLFVEGCVTLICRDFLWPETTLTPEEEAEAAAHAPTGP